MERSGSLQRMSEHVDKVTVGLSSVEALLQQKSPTVKEAESILKVSVGVYVWVCVCFHFILTSNPALNNNA